MNTPQDEEAIFLAAAPLSPRERAAFLDRECAGNAGLRVRLDALLVAHDQPETRDGPGAGRLSPSLCPDHDGKHLIDAVGLTIGRYKLLECLGEGGCGVVYVAEQAEPVRRRVALKLIKPGMDSKAVIARFEAERQALAMMDHPNIAKVLDAGTSDKGRPYFVMELVRGLRITEYCGREKLSIRNRLDLFIKVCQAIQHAHQKGIIHRDIKPSNILVTLHDGVPVPKVIDFGIAKAVEGRLTDATVYTQVHQFLGTPAYMSPEQAEMSGLDIDTRSDIYSLGVLLYELLTGVTPFDAQELVSQGLDGMRRTIREKEPVRPSTRLTQLQRIPEARRNAIREARFGADLDWIVMKCLEKDRTRRYETANGLAADLDRHLNIEPVIARPPSVTYRFQKAWRRNGLLFASGSTVVLGLLIAVVSMGLASRKSRSALAAARDLAKERVLLAIMSCDGEEAERALRLAEKTGLPEPELQLLHAMHLVAASEHEGAQVHLEQVRRMKPQDLMAQALIARTTMANWGWGDYEKLLPALIQAVPRTSEERLFVGCALFPATHERAISLMEQAVQEDGSPLGRVLLASARMTAAADSPGSLDQMQRALDDLAAASAWKPRSVRVLRSAVEVHSAASRLYRKMGMSEGEKHQLELASRAIQQLEQFHPENVEALKTRLAFLIEEGRIDDALKLALRCSREHPGSRFERFTAHVLGMHGRYREAVVLTRSFRDDPVMRAVHFLAAIEVPDFLPEARASAAELSSETPLNLNSTLAGVALNLMLGDTNQSARVARGFLASQGILGRMVIPSEALQVVRYLAGELSESDVLNLSLRGQARCLAQHFTGLHHLARGDRAAALDHLRRATEESTGESTARTISQHILRRMAADPSWPPTIPLVPPRAAPSGSGLNG